MTLEYTFEIDFSLYQAHDVNMYVYALFGKINKLLQYDKMMLVALNAQSSSSR